MRGDRIHEDFDEFLTGQRRLIAMLFDDDSGPSERLVAATELRALMFQFLDIWFGRLQPELATMLADQLDDLDTLIAADLHKLSASERLRAPAPRMT